VEIIKIILDYKKNVRHPVIGIGFKKTRQFSISKSNTQGTYIIFVYETCTKEYSQKETVFLLISFITQQYVNKQCTCMPTELCSYCIHSS